ncbi:MAG: hypothetical protein ACRBI6_04655 [Acidimicrobiales bacterium]
MSTVDEAIELAAGLIAVYRDVGPMPHAGKFAAAVSKRSGVALTHDQVIIIGALLRTSISVGPWWHDIDGGEARRAVKRYLEGEDEDEIATRLGISHTEARKLVQFGAALEGKKLGRFFCKWEATPMEEQRALQLLEQYTHKEVGEKMGRSKRWVSRLVKKTEELSE